MRNTSEPAGFVASHRHLAKQKIHHDSIYTIGETSNPNIASRFGGQESSNERSNGSGSVDLGQPSYQEPTQAHRKPTKEINRIKISRAIEAMRKAQLKQARMNK